MVSSLKPRAGGKVVTAPYRCHDHIDRCLVEWTQYHSPLRKEVEVVWMRIADLEAA